MAVDDLLIESPETSIPPPTVDVPPRPWPGDEGGGQDPGPIPRNAFVAMLLFLGTDFMLFAGLIGAFLVFRFGTESWPPVGQPRLPLFVTTINTVVLLGSGITMFLSWRKPDKVKYLLLTMALGVTFLGIQGMEWLRLLQFGLSLRSSVYGGIFYVLIGCHALHVAAAVLWLVILAIQSPFRIEQTLGIKLAGMYWFLVVALWPLLFGFVYL